MAAALHTNFYVTSKKMVEEQRGSFLAKVLIGGVDDQGASLFFIDSLGSVISDKYLLLALGLLWLSAFLNGAFMRA